MIHLEPMRPFSAEWCLKANWWITYRRWRHWRGRGLTPAQINEKFGEETP